MAFFSQPTLTHYLVLGAILFAISVIGIFLNRRNVIIMLMAIELMLLAVNLNFIAFSHYLDDTAGQIFVFFILTVAAAESAIGLAILVLLFRNVGYHRRRGAGIGSRADAAMSMVCSSISWSPWRRSPAPIDRRALGPEAGARRVALDLHHSAWRSSTVGSAFVLRDVLAGNTFNGDLYIWMTSGDVKFSIGFLIDPLTALMMVGRDLRVADGAHLHHRLHGRRSRLHALLLLHLAVHVQHADAGDGEQLPAAFLRLGGGGSRVVPADRLLVRRARPRSTRT